MQWSRHSADSITANGYLISRYQCGDEALFTAWAPGRVLLLSYWGESAERAKAACAEHKERSA